MQKENSQIYEANIHLKGEMDSSTLIVGDFSTSFPKMDRTSRQKINNEIGYLNNTINQSDLTDIYVYTTQKCTYSSQVYMDILQHRPYMLGPKINFNKLKTVEVM